VPTFAQISLDNNVVLIQTQPNIFMQSVDTQTGEVMKSNVVSIQLVEGGNVCPQGYVLELDSKMSGACKVCQPETYSVNPLVSNQGSCFICPAGAVCPDGSCVFHHSLSYRICLKPETFKDDNHNVVLLFNVLKPETFNDDIM
jgi:hypothetical protein